MEKYISDKCQLVTINGYRAWVDSRGIIIKADEKLKNWLHKNIKEGYERNKHLLIFKYLGTVPYPILLDEDMYKVLSQKHPTLNYLREKLNLEFL